ncbi:MAG TPA: sigma-E processing peptidase SpoIIGA [Lachnospiraceae bacterium]|nr:sigma-E processing peptidase SpoIIGA [Lachnospiraceae bacterium]
MAECDMYEIYIDMVFLLNLWLEFMILRLTARILNYKTSTIKMFLGSILASIGTCIVYIMPQLHYLIRFLFLNVLVNVAVLWIVFRIKTFRRLIRMYAVLYMVSFLLGGFVEWICQTPFFIGERQMNLLQVLVISDVAYLILSVGYNLYRKLTGEQQCRYQATIYYGTKQVSVIGLLDTGNSLLEPISQKPVSILDKEQAQQLCYEEAPQNFRIIPFSSLGKQRGMLRGFEAERMCLTNDTKTVEINKPIIGVNEGRPLRMSRCHLILHPDLIR